MKKYIICGFILGFGLEPFFLQFTAGQQSHPVLPLDKVGTS